MSNTHSNQKDLLPKDLGLHYASIALYISETITRATVNIVFVKDPKKSFKIFSQFGPNQAHNTSPHLSIIPRILIKKRSNTNDKWQTVQDLIQLIDQQTKNLQLPVPDFAGYQILERPTRSLVMNIKVHNDYYMLIEAIELCIGPSCAKLDVSLLDRIHLAYNVLKSPSKSELKKMKGIAESTIDVSDWIKLGGTWKLTLYEVMVESQVVGVQHQLKEVHSWPIHQRPPQPFIDLLPFKSYA
ncbi:hypothetical protein RO3G_11792 [Rhizopus delemar RA 99-880]|uniref:Uncharacterized protein n=1 Tax=Rhizopus delemar (strain RA 99-880 / ATCC MYA-4621 / FGSC 9543 / NRRL 43880) TaxID=246409 RepID=I1CF51_RHIO9|nr:hypothetical protein RO3G_11792 [Rhizopus delemar RA 99-880]|eukprot:EIE87081.1 hypothetical protein RO3G_11792 [Rhizopus delemar RA 99-880]